MTKTMTITREEILMGRDKEYPLSKTLEANLSQLLKALNLFRDIYGKPMIVSSGYRPAGYNTAAKGAKKSNHMICLAADFRDPESLLDNFCIANQDILEKCGLYLEHPYWTNGWCHLQVKPPESGKKIFAPSSKPPTVGKKDLLFVDLRI